MNPIRSRLAAVGLLVAALVAIGVATLTPRGEQLLGTVWWCLVCGELGGIDFLQNLGLFFPLGLGLACCRVSGIGAVIISAAITVAIEAAQLRLVPGRDASLGDIVANTIGAGLGWAAVIGWRRWWWPPVGAWDRSLLWAVVAALLIAGGGWLLTPGYSVVPWYGQLTPSLGHLDQFSGTATDLRLNGGQLAIGGIPSAPAGGSTVSLAGRVTRPGGLTKRVAPILSVFDRDRSEQLLLGQQGRSLVFRARTRASAWGLQTIAVGLPEVFGPESRSEFDGLGSRRDADLIVAATENRRSRSTRLRITPALGWATLLPFGYVHRSAVVTAGWSILWLVGMVMPLGWFATRRFTAVVSVGVVAASLGLSAAAGGLAIPGPLEWAALGGGWALGWWARRIARRRGGGIGAAG